MTQTHTETLPASFRRIRLELAREKDHPGGDAGIGYTLLAPLTPDGHLDGDVATEHKRECKVIRFHRGEESDIGTLRRGPGGAWAFHYDFTGGAEDDDPGYKLGQHRFALGEYITVLEDEGAHTYRVARVDPI